MTWELDDLLLDQPASQRAFRAVKRQRELMSTFQSAARAVTGMPKLQLLLSDNGKSYTDGQDIWLRPRIELGDTLEHVRTICAKRDPITSHPLCPACHQIEKIHQTLWHELFHILEQSFALVDDVDKDRVMGQILTERPGLSGTRAAKLQEQVRDSIRRAGAKVNYMGLASQISPFLPTLVNCLEDARVNRAGYRIRTGTQHMFKSALVSVFEDGIKAMDGRTEWWKDRDENAQVLVGVLCKASGLNPRQGWLSDAVLTALADPALTREIDGLEHSALTAADVYRASFGILEHLRRLGFCRRPDDPEDDEQEDNEDDSQDDVSGPGMESPGDTDESEPDDFDEDSGDSPAELPDGEQSDPAESGVLDSDDDDADNELPESGESVQPDGDDSQEGGTGANEQSDPTDEEGELPSQELPTSGGKSEAGSDGQSTDGKADDNDLQEGDPNANAQTSGRSANADPTVEEDEADEVPVDEVAAERRMNESDPEAVKALILMFGGHDPQKPDDIDDETKRQLGVAVIQADQFDNASASVACINVHRFDKPTPRTTKLAWRCLAHDTYDDYDDQAEKYDMPESLIGSVLLKMRTIFADNKKTKRTGEFRSGRVISTRVASVMAGNNKVFNRPQQSGKKDYFVVLALDVSASTSGDKIFNIKQMGMAFGNLLSRAGVKFAIYAHTGGYISNEHGYEGDVFIVKEEHDQWDTKAQDRLAKLNASGNNLDGHALEFFRKRCDQSAATDKVIFYVTDGSMPEANSEDEKEVLVREIKVCEKKGYTLIGVGISTDSPKRYGLDTICIDEPKDIQLLIRELDRRLAVKR